MDVVFVTPANSKKIYQDLASEYTAIEPPTWSLLLAESCRSKGYKVSIIDCNAESLSLDQTYEKIQKLNPKLICFVVYGQNVNAGTTSMSGAVCLSEYLKSKNNNFKIGYVGSHVQALPELTLNKEKSIDFVFTNEGVYALQNILKKDTFSIEELRTVKGIVFRNQNNKPEFTPAEKTVPQERMDIDLPGYAWDLLPYNKKPLDLYRSPYWHANYQKGNRSPYAALQTSLGCQFKCEFCMINMINRDDEESIGVAGNYSKMRYWSTDFIIKEFDKLINMGVKTIRITDEMFLLNPKYYLPLCEKLKERNKDDKLIMWAYSRIDTVKNPEILKKVREAGIRWLCLGIESGNKNIRLEVSKGKFEDVDVTKIIKQVHDADINVIANYIYGLPNDTEETIRDTFDLSLELCTMGWNTYPAMALPGSKLYKMALEKNYRMPESYEGYSFHAYDCVPLHTGKIGPEKVLELRDKAFIDYHTNEKYLEKVREKFGNEARENILEMSKIKLKRKLIEEAKR